MAQQLASAEQLTADVALWQQRSEAAEAKATDLENRLACSDDALAQMEQLAKVGCPMWLCYCVFRKHTFRTLH
jgi:hypothetical protein